MDSVFLSIIALFSFIHSTSVYYVISRSLEETKIDFQSMHASSKSVVITVY